MLSPRTRAPLPSRNLPRAPAPLWVLLPTYTCLPAHAEGAAKNAPAKGAAAAAGASSPAPPPPAALTDVLPRVEAILSAACATLAGGTTPAAAGAAGGVERYALARLRADLEVQLTSLKNAAFAAGYVAGKGEMVARAERRYA
jgi:hypothetical protein